VALEELLGASDFVVLICNLTPETRGLIGERELRTMKKTAILVNVSRGAVVDEGALFRALSERWIAGAALDVMESEPPDPDNPLLGLSNLIITPHIAGMAAGWPECSWRALCRVLVTISERRWPDSVVNEAEVEPRWKWLRAD
jgi:phosphoglycerate dehydrogenase-like enzyme